MYLGTVQHGLWEVRMLGKYGSVLIYQQVVSCGNCGVSQVFQEVQQVSGEV